MQNKHEDTKCPECMEKALEPRKQVEGNEVTEDGWYCANCQEEWRSNTVFQWEDLDFPVWIEYESYNDTHRLLKNFRRQTGIVQNRVKGASNMKYCVFKVWFKITEDGKVHGPYGTKNGDLIANH